MFHDLFAGIFDSSVSSVISVSDFLLCVAVSLVCGLILAGCHMFRNRYTRSFVVTLALLPAAVCVVIMMVNGNIGAGVAVAGVFGLVRFRSVPGTAREITMVFLTMGAGLIAGMGYLAYALLFTVIMSLAATVCNMSGFGAKKNAARYRTMNVTIPEDLDYTGVFDDIFAEYTTENTLTRVKTTNMGSLFRLTYNVVLKDPAKEKEMIDKIRCRNGNLEISVSSQDTTVAEL